jgi:O-methyltransferase
MSDDTINKLSPTLSENSPLPAAGPEIDKPEIGEIKSVEPASQTLATKQNPPKKIKPPKVNSRTPLPYDLPYRLNYAERIPVLQTFRTALLQHYAREAVRGNPIKRGLRNFANLLLHGDAHLAAECGVYVGSCLVACAEIIRQYKLNAHIYGLDSFEGLPQMTEIDEQYASGLVKEKFRDHGTIFDDTSQASVQAALDEKGLGKYVTLVPGFFSDTLASLPNKPYFFVNLDCDLYDGHLECLEFFYPKMEKGGIIFFDDYNSYHYPMAKEAIDKFMKGRPEALFHLRYGPDKINHTKTFIIKH